MKEQEHKKHARTYRFQEKKQQRSMMNKKKSGRRTKTQKQTNNINAEHQHYIKNARSTTQGNSKI